MIALETVEELMMYAQGCQPREMCGLMFDRDRFLRCPNVAADQEHGFEIAHQDYCTAVFIHGRPWATVHSHPHGPAKISGRDMLLLDAQAAVGNTMKMIIVGCNPMEIKVYTKVDDPFTPYRCEWQWIESEPIGVR